LVARLWLNAIIQIVNQMNRPLVETGTSANLAFAIVVMASYLSIFSSYKPSSFNILIWLIILGIAYLAIGVYGYTYVSRLQLPQATIGYFLLQLPLGGIIVFLSQGNGFNPLILLPLAGQSVLLLRGLWMYVPAGFSALIFTLAVHGYTPEWAIALNSLPVYLAGLFFIMIFTQMALGEEKARNEVSRLIVDLEAANSRLREFATQVEDLTITKERNRLAREIHDGLGHYLTTIYMQIQAATAILQRDPGTAVKTLEKAQILSQEALQDVRRSVVALRSSEEDGLPLRIRIEKLLNDGQASGIHTSLEISGNPRELDSKTSVTLYRAAQEAFSNTRKHAAASKFSISMDYQDAKNVRMTIQDNGRGADKIEGGFGLIGLRERLYLIDGDCEIYTTKGEGFTLQITVPG
jgi:signal transduction histidine kinase